MKTLKTLFAISLLVLPLVGLALGEFDFFHAMTCYAFLAFGYSQGLDKVSPKQRLAEQRLQTSGVQPAV